MLCLTRSRVISRATPPNELNDINEINYKTLFVDDERSRENINREYALTLTELFPTSRQFLSMMWKDIARNILLGMEPN